MDVVETVLCVTARYLATAARSMDIVGAHPTIARVDVKQLSALASRSICRDELRLE